VLSEKLCPRLTLYKSIDEQAIGGATTRPLRRRHDSCNPFRLAFDENAGRNLMWNKDEVHGKVDQIKGKVKESVGEMNNDEPLRQEGEAQSDAGKVEEAFGKGRRKVGEAIKSVGDKIRK
jgi:uncharacterized protein YjbJ (UPF0337 family)